MAGTTSATQRGSHALAASLTESQKWLSNHLIFIGKGELWRGLCVASAALFTGAGVLAPHLDPQILAVLLMVIGSGFVFVSGTRIAPVDQTDRPNVKPQLSPSSTATPHAIAQRVRPEHAVLSELRSPVSSVKPADVGQWCRLTHRMSHELRTPLNAVIGFSEIMNAEVFGPLGAPQYRDYARSIHSSGRILLKSAEDALAITNLLVKKPLPGITPTASVCVAIDDMLSFHQAETQMLNLNLELDLCDALEVVGEAQTLRQILINLMSEAIENAEPGSAVTVHGSAHREEVHISLNVGTSRRKLNAHDESFNMILARTLSQLTDGRLVEHCGEDNWSVTATFQRSNQRDFFDAN